MKRRLVVWTFSAAVIAIALAVAALGQSSEKVVKAQGFLSTSAVHPGDKFKVAVQLDVAPGYHVNAHVPSLDYLVATNVTLQPPSGVKIDPPVYPAPEHKSFAFAPDTKLAVHEGTVIVIADATADRSLKPGDAVIDGRVDVQSCNENQCLAPATLDVHIPIKIVAIGSAVTPANADIFEKAAAQPTGPSSPTEGQSPAVKAVENVSGGENQVSNWIGKYGLGVTLFFVFLSGLALNTTPCVYPIIPITIGFFANQSKEGQTPRMGRLFAMASCYVLGIAITYSVLGVIASLTHGLFGSALRSPIVLIGLALIMLALALSMFGVYEFRLPEFLNRFATSTTQATSGLLGALVMGLTMGIVAAPCIGPFVVALLVHVGAKGSPSYGFLLFFVLSLGLGAPYLVLGTFSGAISRLPRSGMWMVTVRRVFGLVLLGMAQYFLMPLIQKYATPIFVAFFAACAIYLIFWEARWAKPKQFGWVLRVLGLAAAGLAVFLVVPRKTEAEIGWQPYTEQALEIAKASGKPVIIDAYADWCIPCRELDNRTFTDAAIKKEADKFVMLKLNLTTKTPGSETARAVDRYQIPGVPTVVFIDSSGNVANGLTLQEFEKPKEFIERMTKLASIGAAGNSTKSSTPVANAELGGKPLPAANPAALSGGVYNFSARRGKVLVIDFWATWCVPCASEIPMFNAMQQQYKDKGFEIVGVSTDEGGAAQVKPFLAQHPMQYAVAIAADDVKKAFGVGDTLPVTLVVDKQGRIRYSHTGITPQDELRTEVEGLLKE